MIRFTPRWREELLATSDTEVKTMKSYRILILVIVCWQLTGCHVRKNDSDFYIVTKTNDLWRFPLIQPYELVSPTNSGDWFLKITLDSSQLHKDFFYQDSDFQVSDIESLGIKDSTIVMHCNDMYWPKLGGQFSSTVFIHCRTGKVSIFSNKHHAALINQAFMKFNVEDIHLYQLENLVKDFQKLQHLPEEWTK